MLMNRLIGIEVARDLTDELPGLITTLITGHPLAAMESPIDDSVTRVVHKPFEIATLRGAITELLREAKHPV